MLIDHGNCEKKAAGAAFQLMFRYVDKPDLQNKMSRLAREELRHFEQVLAIVRRREIQLRNVGSSRYAAGLRELVRNHEPYRLTDTLVIGAFIEARSCERFAMLVPHLDEELGKFYHGLLKSEARHFQDYLKLAYQYGDAADVDAAAPLSAVWAQFERWLLAHLKAAGLSLPAHLSQPGISTFAFSPITSEILCAYLSIIGPKGLNTRDFPAMLPPEGLLNRLDTTTVCMDMTTPAKAFALTA